MQIKRFLKSFLITLLVLATGALLAIGGVKLIKYKKAQMTKIPPAKNYAMVVPVETARISDIMLTTPYLAEVQSDSDVKLSSKVTARIKYIVNSGVKVKPGDVLVRLDAGDLKAKKKGLQLKIREVNDQIRAKMADLKNLQQVHEHSRKLLKIHAIPQEKFDSEASQIESLKASIQSIRGSIAVLEQNILELEDTLDYAVIKSPISGVVSKTYAAKGAIAGSGKALLSLSGGDDKRIVVRVSDNIKPKALIYKGKPCPLSSLNSSFNGLDEYSCDVKTSLPAGNRVEVRLLVYSGKGVLLPYNAVLEINGKHQTLLLKKNGEKNGKKNEEKNEQGAVSRRIEQAFPQTIKIIAEGSEGLLVEGVSPGDDYVVAKPDILLKLMTGVPVIRANALASVAFENDIEKDAEKEPEDVRLIKSINQDIENSDKTDSLAN